MNDIDFKNGFLCGLLATGLKIGGDGSAGGESMLPTLETLDIINLFYYKNAITYLKEDKYTPLISTNFSYMPKEGYVSIGGLELYDFEGDDWWSDPEADIKITVDDEVVYEGDSWEFFDYETLLGTPKTYKYSSNFEFAAKRRNMSDGMQMELRNSVIVGIN